MDILKRFKQIADNQQITISKLEQVIGASKGVLSRALANNSDIQSKWIVKLVENYPQYNTTWLITGEGTMFEEKVIEDQNIGTKDFSLRTDKLLANQIIPYYDMNASASLITLFQADRATPVNYYSIPNLPKVDGAISVTGDSMYPILKSGDIIFYSKINNLLESIYYGEMYLLDIRNEDDEYTTVKYVQTSDKGQEWIKLVSHNQHHSAKDIKLEWVKAAAFIKGSLRINSMR